MLKYLAIATVLLIPCGTFAQQPSRAPTPDESRLMDQMWRDTTMTRSSDPRAVQPPITKANPAAPYSQWGNGTFGNGDKR